MKLNLRITRFIFHGRLTVVLEPLHTKETVGAMRIKTVDFTSALMFAYVFSECSAVEMSDKIRHGVCHGSSTVS